MICGSGLIFQGKLAGNTGDLRGRNILPKMIPGEFLPDRILEFCGRFCGDGQNFRKTIYDIKTINGGGNLSLMAVDDTMTEIGKKYLKRAISYYLLKELGFDMSYLQNIDATLIDADSDASLMKDSTWNNLITGLSSMPIVGKDKSGALQQAGKALKSVQRDTGWADLMAIRDRFKDINIWGDGKEGRILIGADGKTFEFKDNTGFQKVETLETTGKTFKQDSENISESAQHAIMQFALAIKIELARF